MKDLFIQFDKAQFPALAALTAARNAVVAAMDAVEAPKVGIQQAKGERKDRGHEKYLECECAYEAAGIKLSLANETLLDAIRTLHAAVDKVEQWLQKDPSGAGTGVVGVAQLNVRCALELADRATALHYHLKRRWLDTEKLIEYCIGISQAYAEGPAFKAPREFVIMASAHCSKFRFDGPGDGSEPPPAPYMTFNEAVYSAVRFARLFDNYQADAKIYNVRTKEIIPLKPEWFHVELEELPRD